MADISTDSQSPYLLADKFRATLPIEPTTGERPLYVPNDYPGYKPAYTDQRPVEANLVLEGGSMRVQFTAGVLDFFSDMGFFPKNVIGVSAGALSGFNYIMGARGRTCALNIGFCGDKRYMSLYSFLTTGNAFNAEMSFKQIPFDWMPYKLEEFTNSPCDLTVVASNLRTCKAEYFPISDPVAGMSAMKASASMPFVSKTETINGDPFLDGGVCDTIPIDYSMQTGMKKQIVVLSQDRTFVQQPNKANDLAYIKYREYPEFAYKVAHRYEHVNERREYCMRLAREGKIFLIMPPERIQLDILENDLQKLYSVYEMGYQHAQDVWPDLQEYMERQ